MAKLAILACLVASIQGLRLRIHENHCEAIQPSDDAKFDSIGHRTESITDKFAISICRRSADGMEGEFRITKKTGCSSNLKQHKFVQTEELQALVQEKFGPDEFVFLLEGPEVRSLHATPSYSNRDCKYVLPYKLVVPGKYHLNLVWTRENYDAMNEKNHFFPPAHMDLPLGTEAFLQFGSGSTEEALKTARSAGPKCNYKDSKASLAGRWVYKGAPERMFAKRKARCVDFSFQEGKFLSGIINGVRAPETFSCQTGKWLHAQVDYKEYEWIPETCQPRRFTKEEAKQCLSKNKLLIRGDSHLRKLYSAVANYACDLPDVDKGQVDTCAATDARKPHSCGDMPAEALCFKQDYIGVGGGDWKKMPQLANYSLTVVNFGQHQADGSHQQPLASYQKGVHEYVTALKQQLPENQGKVAWHETNALPFREDWYVKNAGDWRTYQRLQLFNEQTTPAFQNLGVPVIASYEPTYSMSLHAFDPSHFPKEILMPQVQNVLGLLCAE